MKRLRGLCAVILLATSVGVAAQSAGAMEWGKGYLPNVPVVSQTGQPLHFYDDVLKGKTVLISFIYTSCHDICPVITARLAQVQEKLGDSFGKDVEFVSISIDPVTDTPSRLKEYADAFGAEKGWTFLTGRKDDIDQLRYKLGERGRGLSDHRNSVLLYNDTTGEWSKDSAFSDINVLTDTIRTMSPALAAGRQTPEKLAAVPAMQTIGHAELPGQTLFIKTCGACHTIGKGTKVGPDLANLSDRRSRDWITGYMTNPAKMRADKDPTALALQTQFPAVRMPNLSINTTDASDLMAYVDAMTYAAADAKRGHGEHHHADSGHMEGMDHMGSMDGH